MNLKYITCSDPREFNDIHDIVKLAKFSPRVEIAVQAHPSKMSHGMPRNEWFRELVQYVQRDKHDINLAVHVNREWCDAICRTGKIPLELKEFFDARGERNRPLIKRWQLNVPQDTAANIDIYDIYALRRRLIDTHNNHEFILQYNTHTKHMVSSLFMSNFAKFSFYTSTMMY